MWNQVESFINNVGNNIVDNIVKITKSLPMWLLLLLMAITFEKAPWAFWQMFKFPFPVQRPWSFPETKR